MAGPGGSPTRLNVLFIGNSFTARNDVPGMVARLAAGNGLHLEHRLISRGGASLRMHWNRPETAQVIGRGLDGQPWDYVVLQEQSTLPVKNAARMHENVRDIDAAIRAAGSRTVLYMTWARRNMPAPQTQRAITEAYASIGRELGAAVVPAGVAWERVLARPEPPALHDKDQSHPTLAGSYLAACVIFGVLFGRSPVGGWTPEALIPAESRMLQQAAAGVCADSEGGRSSS